MASLEKPLCVIPARGGSQRFPRKNIALLNGKPLIAYAIETALESGVFDTICVSSEDDEILAVARQYGDDLVYKRPAELATNTAQIRHVCRYLLNDFAQKGRNFSEFGILLVTNPLRTAQDVRDAYALFKEQDAHYLLSLVPFDHAPQNALWAPPPDHYVQSYFGREYVKQSQLLDKLYRHDGSVIFARSNVFLAEFDLDFYGSKVIPYYVDPERSVDIDTPLDLLWAEFLMTRGKLKE